MSLVPFFVPVFRGSVPFDAIACPKMVPSLDATLSIVRPRYFRVFDFPFLVPYVASAGSAVGRGIMTAGRSATGAVQRAGGSIRTAVKKAVTPVKPGKDSTMGLAKKVVGQQIAKLPRGSAQQQLAARLASSGFKAAQSTPAQFALQKPMMTSAILGAGRRIRGNVSGRTQRGPEFR